MGLMTFASRPALAQEAGDPADAARFRFGPLRFTPGISFTNVGVDTNVFNDAVDPKRDRTANVGPGVTFWLNVGPSRFRGKSDARYLYFATYESQRSWS